MANIISRKTYQPQIDADASLHPFLSDSEKRISVEAGREWVNAYVKYIVFIHSLYDSIQKGPAHGV